MSAITSSIKSPFYLIPSLYDFHLRLLHGYNVFDRYQIIADKIGNRSVLDVGCGTALLANHVRGEYNGFDLNPRFIKHNRRRGINSWVGNATTHSAYRQEADVIAMIDFLHHVPCEEWPTILGFAERCAREMLIICEPFYSYPILKDSRLFPLLAFFNDILGNDGMGAVRLRDRLNRGELYDIMIRGFNALTRSYDVRITPWGKEDLIGEYRFSG